MPSSCKTLAMSFVLMPQLLATFFAHRLCTLSLQTAHTDKNAHEIKYVTFIQKMHNHYTKHTIHGYTLRLSQSSNKNIQFFSSSVNHMQMEQ